MRKVGKDIRKPQRESKIFIPSENVSMFQVWVVIRFPQLSCPCVYWGAGGSSSGVSIYKQDYAKIKSENFTRRRVQFREEIF